MPTQKEKSGLNMQDIALSAQSGLARGVESALSLPDLAGRGISFLLEKPMSLLGIERITPEEKEKSEILDIRRDIVEPVATAAGARYEPQTVAGELTQRTAELLPFAPTRHLLLPPRLQSQDTLLKRLLKKLGLERDCSLQHESLER